MTIIGPNYSTPEYYFASLSGTQFSYSTPKYNHPRIPYRARDKRMINLYDSESFVQSPPSDNEKELYSTVLTVLSWVFWQRQYFILSHEAAICDFEARVFHLPEFNSLFNKEIFECATERLIFGYGGSFSSTKQCRLNWRIEKFNKTEWVVFENNGRYSSDGLHDPYKSTIQTFYLTPISNEHMLSVCFTQVKQREVKELDNAFSKLRKFIMSSSELKLSEDAIRQKTEIESQFPQQSYSQTLPPYEFEKMNLPERQQARILLQEQRGDDAIIEMSESAYSSAVDDLEKELRNKYHQQVDDILESHLRFKK